jgi:phosphatidate phosphatase
MLQFGLIAFSIYVGLSRVSDYKHHWSDVTVGLIQGAAMAILVVSIRAAAQRPPAAHLDKSQKDTRQGGECGSLIDLNVNKRTGQTGEN